MKKLREKIQALFNHDERWSMTHYFVFGLICFITFDKISWEWLIDVMSRTKDYWLNK